MEPQQAIGFAHFLAQTDELARALLLILLVMSAATWYLIVTKAWTWMLTQRRTRRFLDIFWNSPSLSAVAAHLEEHHPDEPFSHLAWHAIVSSRHHERHGTNRLNESGSRLNTFTRMSSRCTIM